MKISIFGLGYVGCVSLGCFAEKGHRIIGVDLDKTKVKFINDGKPTVMEKGIDEIIARQKKLGTISAVNDAIQAVKTTEVSYICVGTPSTSNGHLDLSAVFKVSEEIGRGIKEKGEFHVLVIRSTVLPGTNERVSEIVEKTSGKICGEDFAIVSNPEFLREGSAVSDFYHPPYTLIGSSNDKAIQMMKQIYEGIESPLIVTDVKIAEIIKYVNNTFHALKITFANEVGNICKKLEIDSHKLMDIFVRDTKLNISPIYLRPGFSYGGSCLPKDLQALKTIAHDYYIECPVLENISRSNAYHSKQVYDQIIRFNKEKVGFLGLSFKEGTDDLRNSPIVDIIEQLLGKGFDIRIYDKNVHLSRLTGANREYILRKIPYISKFIIGDPSVIIDSSEVIVVVNKDDEFKSILKKVPKDRIIYDLVNIDFQQREVMQNYFGISW